MARDGEETASESEGWPAGDADETARTATIRGETARDGEGKIIGITKAPLETSSKMRPRTQLETGSKMGEPVEEPMGESKAQLETKRQNERARGEPMGEPTWKPATKWEN